MRHYTKLCFLVVWMLVITPRANKWSTSVHRTPSSSHVERRNEIIKKKNDEKAPTEIQMGVRCRKLGAWTVGIWHTGCSKTRKKKPWLFPLPSVCAFQWGRWMWRTMTVLIHKCCCDRLQCLVFYTANSTLPLIHFILPKCRFKKKKKGGRVGMTWAWRNKGKGMRGIWRVWKWLAERQRVKKNSLKSENATSKVRGN